MAYTFLTSTSAGSADNNNVTTTAIDTTGADLIVLGVVHNQPEVTPTDSQSNTWTRAVTQGGAVAPMTQIWYSQAPTTNAAHTFTVSTGNDDPSLIVFAFSGSVTSPKDQDSGATVAAVTSGEPGSVTPTEGNELLVTLAGFGTKTVTSPSAGGYTTAETVAGDAEAYACAMAYLIQTNAAASNPTWSWTATSNANLVTATFKDTPSGSPGSLRAGAWHIIRKWRSRNR